MTSIDSISLKNIDDGEVSEVLKTNNELNSVNIEEIRKTIVESCSTPRRGPLSRIFFLLTTLITTVAVIVFGVIGNLFQMITAPLMLCNRLMVVRWHSYLAGFIWSILQNLFEVQSGIKFTISGLENIPRKENAYVIANHACFADFAIVHAVAIRKGMLSFCKYFVKDSVKYIPIFGWGMKIMGMVMLKRDWNKDRAKFASLFELFSGGKLPVYLVSYPEGSRITPSKLKRSHDYAEKNNLPRLKHLLLPRSKGFIATMLGLQTSDVHYLYDVTCTYYHEKKGLGSTWGFGEMFTSSLDGYHVHIHVDRIPFSTLPKGEEELKSWIFNRFQQKDRIVDQIGSIFEQVFAVGPAKN